MKKLLVLFLVLVPSAAFAAGVDIKWNACIGTGPETTDKVFDCAGTTNQNYDLQFMYQTAVDVPNFVAVSGYADIGPTGAVLSPFWHFEGNGCNGSAIKGAAIIGAIPVTCADNYLETWDGGLVGTFAIAAYGADFLQVGRGHFILLGARGDAVPVTANTKYWAFAMRFNNKNRPGSTANCLGCSEQKVLVWQTARLESNDGSPAVDLSGPDQSSDCVTINGASVGGCGVTPALRTTWGSMKSLYR